MYEKYVIKKGKHITVEVKFSVSRLLFQKLKLQKLIFCYFQKRERREAACGTVIIVLWMFHSIKWWKV